MNESLAEFLAKQEIKDREDSLSRRKRGAALWGFVMFSTIYSIQSPEYLDQIQQLWGSFGIDIRARDALIGTLPFQIYLRIQDILNIYRMSRSLERYKERVFEALNIDRSHTQHIYNRVEALELKFLQPEQNLSQAGSSDVESF